MRCFFVVATTLLLLLLAGRVEGQATVCETQLHNYYVGLGMPGGTAVQPVVALTSGTFLGSPFVTATMTAQAAARFYQNVLNPALVNETWATTYSIDIPWCVSRVVIQCCNPIVEGMAKSSACTTLVDFDQGPPSLIAGRYFLYVNQSCGGGTVSVQYFNVTLQPGQANGTYTYDAVGIKNHVQLNTTEAQFLYRTSPCNETDGSPASMAGQSIFVCVEEAIGCAGNRTTSPPSAPVVPIPMYQCIGNLTPNGTVQTLWAVLSMQVANTIDQQFQFTTVNQLNSPQYYEAILAQLGVYYELVSGSRRQFASPYTDLNQFALLNYNGQWWNYPAQYTFSNNPALAILPCMCDFNADCINGTVDLTSIASGTVRLNNAVPVPDAGPDAQINWFTPSFLLNASGSYDPDQAPKPLSVFWRVNSTPYDPAPPPFNISDPRAFEVLINTSQLQPGYYIFELYASDGQAWPFVYFNLTILGNVVTAVVELNKVVPFTLYSGADPGHDCVFFPPRPCIPINGTQSFGTNPNITLYYQWSEQSGFQLTYFCTDNGQVPTTGFFNTTSPVACFVPGSFGFYFFQLFVTDNQTSSTAILQVQVVPDFQQPPSTLTPIINFTDPPILNFTPPPLQNFNFSNATIPPLAPSPPVPPIPPGNVTPPPIKPVWPPLTPLQQVLGVLNVLLALILLWTFAMGSYLMRDKTQERWRDVVRYGPNADG